MTTRPSHPAATARRLRSSPFPLAGAEGPGPLGDPDAFGEGRGEGERPEPHTVQYAATDPVTGRRPVIRLTLGTNNVFALPGADGVTLVDAGPDYEGAWEELHAQLRTNGIAPESVRTVLLTHAHLDHAGLAARWQAFGAEVHVGHDDAPMLALDDPAREQERARARRELFRHGVPAEALARSRPEAVAALSPTAAVARARRHDPSAAETQRYTRWPGPLRMTPLQPDSLLRDGDCVCSGRPLRVIACPGHTPGTLLLLDEASGALFAGDQLLPRMAPGWGIQFDDGRRRPSLPPYLASLHATRALAPVVHTVYPGHGEPFNDLADAVDWTVRIVEQRTRRTLAKLHAGPGAAYEVALRMFPHLDPRHLRAVMAEMLGFLDLLAARGQAVAEESEEHVIWRATG